MFAPLLGYAADSQRKPNIIYILADDLGLTDLGAQGSQYYETPNIDKLAAEGARLTRYHNCQNCQPTRAALMTGQYGARTGVYAVGGIDRFDWRSRPLAPVYRRSHKSRATISGQGCRTSFKTGRMAKNHRRANACAEHPHRFPETR
jgi:hypothetical protein